MLKQMEKQILQKDVALLFNEKHFLKYICYTFLYEFIQPLLRKVLVEITKIIYLQKEIFCITSLSIVNS